MKRILVACLSVLACACGPSEPPAPAPPPWASLELPRLDAWLTAPDSAGPLVVLGADGTTTVDGAIVASDEALAPALAARIARRAELREVVIAADSNARWRRVIRVLEACTDASVEARTLRFVVRPQAGDEVGAVSADLTSPHLGATAAATEKLATTVRVDVTGDSEDLGALSAHLRTRFATPPALPVTLLDAAPEAPAGYALRVLAALVQGGTDEVLVPRVPADDGRSAATRADAARTWRVSVGGGKIASAAAPPAPGMFVLRITLVPAR